MKQILELILDVFLCGISCLLVLMSIHIMIVYFNNGDRESGLYVGIVTIVFLLFWKTIRLDIKLYKLENKERCEQNNEK